LPVCFFASDLHGHRDRYQTLHDAILDEKPDAVFLGGDLLPSGLASLARESDGPENFIEEYLAPTFRGLKNRLGTAYPRLFLILGNDDCRAEETALRLQEHDGIWCDLHGRKAGFGSFTVYGYACVPPTPFLLKDWERYDVSRHVDPGCVSPEEGYRSMPVDPMEVKWGTMEKDLGLLTGSDDLADAIFLFHVPPYDTPLDRADLDGKLVEHVPLDPHVGSIAVRRLIEQRSPRVTLHGHVHEAVRLTGIWKIQLGRTTCLGGAHDGPELALIRFDPAAPELASRELL
jgi:uncharacterized protein